MTELENLAQAKAFDNGAPVRDAQRWDQANWSRITAEVKRLQVRIAKAVLEGRWGKVKALQRLLTRSFSGKILAVKRVTENRGKRTPGVDGKIWSTSAAKWKGMKSLQHHGYRAMPLRRIYIPKSNGQKRPLSIPCMRCRSMQALWKLALEPIAESTADLNSYGFRPYRSTADAIGQCFTTLAQRTSAEWILEGDIRNCFGSISSTWLLENIPMDKLILRRWLQAGYISENTLFDSTDGVPQGGIASPVLANMALDGLEAAIYASVGSSERARRKAKLNVIRYADDFVVTGISKDILQHQVLPAVKQFMATRGLELSLEKTRITHISQGFDSLGQNVRKYAGKLLIKPARKSVKSLLDKVREIVKRNLSATQETIIQKLNPVIRGWAMYHRHVVSKATFSLIDSHIWQTLWKWAKRRHPNKGARWVIRKYFQTIESRNWVFATKDPSGRSTDPLQIFRSATIPIVRHVKIQARANPFDPIWAQYFRRRQTKTKPVIPPGATPWRRSMA